MDNRARGQDNFSCSRCRQWDGNDSGNRDRDNRDRNNDGHNSGNRGRRWDGNRGQGNSDRGWGRRRNTNPQYPQQDYPKHYPDQNHYMSPPMGCQYQYQLPYEQYPPHPQLQQQYSQRPPAQSQQAANICQLCQNQGHYDYQCQFAGDFMARTQKAFNQGHSYNHQDTNQGEWLNRDNDNDDPNGQPFQ